MIPAYNRRMSVDFRASQRSFSVPLLFSCLFVAKVGSAQTSQRAAPPAAGAEAERAVSLAESDHCAKPHSLFRKSISQTENRYLKKGIGPDCAKKLDVGFSEVYLGLKMSLNSAKRFADAIPVLETGEKMAPDSPTGHYQLAFAYTGTGRRDDANREAALQRQTAEALEAVKRKALVLEKQETPDPRAPEQK
jgi:hypothetical protein